MIDDSHATMLEDVGVGVAKTFAGTLAKHVTTNHPQTLIEAVIETFTNGFDWVGVSLAGYATSLVMGLPYVVSVIAILRLIGMLRKPSAPTPVPMVRFHVDHDRADIVRQRFVMARVRMTESPGDDGVTFHVPVYHKGAAIRALQ